MELIVTSFTTDFSQYRWPLQQFRGQSPVRTRQVIVCAFVGTVQWVHAYHYRTQSTSWQLGYRSTKSFNFKSLLDCASPQSLSVKKNVRPVYMRVEHPTPLAYCVLLHFKLAYCVRPYFSIAYCVPFNNKNNLFGVSIYIVQSVTCTGKIILINIFLLW